MHEEGIMFFLDGDGCKGFWEAGCLCGACDGRYADMKKLEEEIYVIHNFPLV